MFGYETLGLFLLACALSLVLQLVVILTGYFLFILFKFLHYRLRGQKYTATLIEMKNYGKSKRKFQYTYELTTEDERTRKVSVVLRRRTIPPLLQIGTPATVYYHKAAQKGLIMDLYGAYVKTNLISVLYFVICTFVLTRIGDIVGQLSGQTLAQFVS